MFWASTTEVYGLWASTVEVSVLGVDRLPRGLSLGVGAHP